MEHTAFNWIATIPGLEHYPNHVVMAVFISLMLIAVTAVARVKLAFAMKQEMGGIIPDDKWSFLNFFEIVAEQLYKLTESVIGSHDTPTYFPLIGTLFIFIFVSNLFGLVPGFLPPTSDFNMTLALGVFVFFYYNFAGIRAHGLAYLKHFMGPIWWLAPLLFVIEFISHLVRPLSLGLRLRGNIMGDHEVLTVFSSLVPYILPVVFYGLGVFVALVQAFVFCLLTMVYISLSTSHDH